MKYIPSFDKFLNESSFLKVAVYYDYGVGQNTIAVWSNFFRKFFGAEPKELNAENFRYEILKKQDLVVIPGGKGYKESLSMTDEDKDGLKRYVSEGGKLLAICAGAFLVTEANSWSLDMVPLGHDAEKNGHLSDEVLHLDFNITEKGQEVFNTSLAETNIFFHGGPAFFKTNGNCEALLTFKDEIPHDNEVEDYTKGLVAAAYSTYGSGRIITVSPHIEKTEMYQYLLANGINYLIKA